jgi:hypothetical protein
MISYSPERKEVLGWILAFCRFANVATHEIGKGELPSCLAFIRRA